MIKLCEAAVQKKEEKQLEQMSMVLTLKLRLEQFNSFMTQQSLLFQLCQTIDPQIEGRTNAYLPTFNEGYSHFNSGISFKK